MSVTDDSDTSVEEDILNINECISNQSHESRSNSWNSFEELEGSHRGSPRNVDALKRKPLHGKTGENENSRKEEAANPFPWKHILVGSLFLFGYYVKENFFGGSICIREIDWAEYSNQNEDLIASVESMLADENPRGDLVSSMVLLHAPDDSQTALCIATRIARTFACRKAKTTAFRMVKPAELNVKGDHGKLLARFKNESSVVIQNPTEIQYDKAQIFHTLCDDITKFREPTLYIFLVQGNLNFNEQPVSQARRILQNAWGALPHNVLDPLMSRVLGHVIFVGRETNLKNC